MEDCFGQFFSSARFKPICSVCQTQMVVMSLQLVIRPVGDDAGQAIASLTIHKEGVTIELAEGSEEECRRVLSVLLPDGANAHPAGITEGDSGDH